MKLAALLSAVAVLVLPVAPVLANGAPEATEKLDPKDPNYVRCRKLSVTGSLVKKERLCKTNAEWAKATEDAQRNADDLIGRNRVGTNGQ